MKCRILTNMLSTNTLNHIMPFVLTLVLSACFPVSQSQSSKPTELSTGYFAATDSGVTPTESLSTLPSLGSCDTDFLLYTVQVAGTGQDDASGVFITCPNNDTHKKLISFGNAAPSVNVEAPGRVTASHNGASIVFSYHDIDRIWRVVSINLQNNTLTELVSSVQITRGADISPDGTYIGYWISDSQDIHVRDRLEIMHLESKKVSIFADMEDTSIISFDWSPDSKNILLNTLGPLGQNQTLKTSVINVECESISHICMHGKEITINNATNYPSWDSNSSIISTTKFNPDSSPTIQITDLQDKIIRTIDLGSVRSDLRNIEVRQPIMSSDGQYIAFLRSYTDILVLNLNDMSVSNVTSQSADAVYSSIAWIPKDASK